MLLNTGSKPRQPASEKSPFPSSGRHEAPQKRQEKKAQDPETLFRGAREESLQLKGGVPRNSRSKKQQQSSAGYLTSGKKKKRKNTRRGKGKGGRCRAPRPDDEKTKR